jgi:hypothetical protein
LTGETTPFGPVEAIKACWAITRGHFWGLFGVFLLLVSLYAVAGMPTCGVGAILGAPYVLLVSAPATGTSPAAARPA